MKAFQEVFNMQKIIVGPDHSETLIIKGNIALTLFKQGKYNEALKYYQEILGINKTMLGENHPNTLSTKHNIAGIFLSSGRYDEALQMFQEIYNIQEATLGKNHSETLNTKNSIAGALANQSKYDEALQIFQEIRNIQEATLGKNHRNIILTKNNIAGMLFAQGKYSDALQMFQEVLNIDKAVLGENHPDVLCTHRQVAEVLRNQGKYDKALEICQEVFDKQKDTLGSDHPHTLNTQYSKALTLDGQGKYNDALQIYQEVLSKRKVILGNDHPDTLKTSNCIAVIFSKQGEYNKAFQNYQEVLKVQKSSLGENHPDTLATKNNMGMVLYNKKEYDQALQIFQEVFNKLQKFLPDHPDTLTAKNNIALALYGQKKHDEALKMFREVLDSQEASLGKGHYSITTTKHNIASILLTQGRHNDALKVLQEVFNEVNKVLGPEHPETLEISSTIQSLLMSANDLLIAVKNDNLEKIENLVEKGGDVNTKDNDDRTLLHYAVNNGNINIVNVLLKNGADVTQITNKGNTPLHIATSRGHKEIVEVLLQHISHDKLNNFINVQTTTGGTTSLHVAAKNGFSEIVKSLLKYGAIYNIKNKEGKTPFDLSKDQNVINLLKLVRELFEDAKDGNFEIISKLKAVKPDEFRAVANAYNNQGNTLLQIAITNKHKNIASVLLEMLKKPDKIQSCSSHECGLDQFKRLKSAAELHIKCSELYLPMLRSMSQSYGSEKNPDPWKTLKEGSDFLRNAYGLVEKYKECMPGAIDDKNMQVINATLVGLEFDPKHIYSGGVCCTAVYYKLLHSELKKDVRLFIEVVERDIDVPVKRFLESVEQKLQSVSSFEKLFKAIENNNRSEVENCIKEGAIVNSKHNDGRTPLHYAVNNGNIGIINTLLSSGADATQVTNKDNTPLHIAASKGYKEIVEVLLQHVSRDKLNNFINFQTTTGGTTSLHVAAKNGFLEIVKSLLKYGAIYDIKNKEGKTPFDLSKDQNVINLLKLVRELFKDAKDGNLEIISKLKAVKPDEFVAVANAYNNQGNTLMKVAITNKHKNIASVLLEMLKKPDKIQSCSSHECGLDQFKRLKYAAELHIKFSELYLPMLRSMSQSYGSEKNPFPWKTLKEGSYFLGNAYSLVKTYKECMPGAIDDKNMQVINATLVGLEFDPKHITSGYTDEAYGGKAICFVSKGQGTVYYKLLHSELKKYIRFFIEMVERDIDVPVKKFLESVEQKLQSVSSFEKLFKAIENNNCSEVETCIKEGAIVNSKHTDGRTPLHYAVTNGNIDIINTLLTSGADATQVTNKDNTPLHTAVSKGYKEIVEDLLQHVSRDKLNNFINFQTTTGGTTLLHVAAKNGFLEIVKSLLKYGAIYNIKNKEGKTPFDLSKDQNVIDLLKLVRELFKDAKDGNLEIISKLKAVKPDEFVAVANAYNNQGNTLMQVAITNQHKNIASVLLEMLMKPDKIQSCSSHECGLDQFERLKSYAENHIKFSELYLPMLRRISQSYGSEKNLDPWKAVKEGSYYLGNAYQLVQTYKECMPGAIDDKNMQVINATLVGLEYDPKHQTSGYTDEAYGGKAKCFVSKGQGTVYYKLLHSELKKDVRLFIEMVERDIDVPVKRFLESVEQKLQSVSSFEKLFKAIENNNCSEVETCIKEGAIVNSKHNNGRTPLHYAVNNGNIDIINILLTSGADATQVTNKDNTSLHIAASKGYKEIVEVLLQHVSRDKLNDFINAQTTTGGTTSLHVAAKNGFLEIVKSLLKYGAIYNIKNKEGKTPFDLSKDQNVIDLLKLVRELFEDAKDGNLEIISKLKAVKPDEFVAVANAYNNQGNTLLQVAIINKHKNACELLEML